MSGYRLGHSARKVITSITWIIIVVVSLPPNSSFGQNRDSSATFAAMKEAVPQMLGGATYDSVFIVERGIVDLVDCGGGGYKLGLTQQDPFFNEAATAVWAVLLRQKLSRLGLADIGEPYIRRVEQVTLVRMPVRDGGEFSDAKDPILQEMALALNSATHARNLPGGFVTEGGCGAGEVAYRLAPSDQSVRLFVIKLFYFLICKARGINPNAVDSCIGWQEATGRAHLAGSGAYRYLAQWPDGSITNGSFEINDRVISDIDDKTRSDLLIIPIRR